MKRLFIILALTSVSLCSYSQELRCNVQVNSDKIEGSSKQVFNTLEKSISDYVNNTRWTNMTFSETERIECNMTLILSQVTTDGQYSGELIVQSRRPVYGSSYTTPLVNFRDNNFTFTYQEYDRLDYQETTFTTNLTAMLAYYCYLIIGYDMDSFSRLGGTPFFQQCENIVTAAQTASMEDAEQKGWKAFDSNRNRYALINNLLDEAFRKFREYYYTYHRLGLDEMQQNVANARARIAAEMPILKETNKARPATFAVNTFLDAKADEIVEIFKKGTSAEKKSVYDLLIDIDPTRQNTYEKINEP